MYLWSHPSSWGKLWGTALEAGEPQTIPAGSFAWAVRWPWGQLTGIFTSATSAELQVGSVGSSPAPGSHEFPPPGSALGSMVPLTLQDI
jgi:hypothetical protein